MGRKFTDNALTTLASSITNVSTTLSVAAGKGANFPAVTGRGTPGATPDYYVITLEDSSGNREKIRVEHRAADAMGSGGFPLIRGYDGTVARAWNTGDNVDLRWDHSEAEDAHDRVVASMQGFIFGNKGSTTSGLNYGYFGGVIDVAGTPTAVADGLVALTASQTNYVERDSSGVVSANIVGFTAGKWPMAQVVTDSAGITSITDKRAVGGLLRPTFVNSSDGATQTLTDAATISWDMNKGTRAKVTLTASGHTLDLPTNLRAGSSGWIDLIQDGTGNRTMSFHATYKHPLGSPPVLSTGAGVRDRLYWSYDGTTIDCTFAKGMA